MTSEVYRKVSVPYDQDRLISTYLSRWSFPPSEAKDVIKITSCTTLVVANHANLDWGFNQLFDTLGLKPEDIGIYITSPGWFPDPHTDGSSTGETREWALNFPLMNCDRGYTTWHKHTNTNFQTITDSKQTGTIYNKTDLDPNDIEEIARIRMDGPYMVKTNILHSIDNRDNNNPRAVLTFRFKNTTWDQATQLFMSKI